jgi:hypothetical protein
MTTLSLKRHINRIKMYENQITELTIVYFNIPTLNTAHSLGYCTSFQQFALLFATVL